MKGKRIGVWLDHHRANFITHEPLNEHIQTIYSSLDPNGERVDGEHGDGTRWAWAASNNEYSRNHKAMEELDRYYDTLSKLLEEYDEILLFGPTDAKHELRNKIKANKHFDGKKIHVESSDKLSETKLLEYVRKFYEADKVKK